MKILLIEIIIIIASNLLSETSAAKTFKWCGVLHEPIGHCNADLYVPAHGKFKHVIADHVNANLQNDLSKRLAARAGMELDVNKAAIDLSNIAGIDDATELVSTLVLYERVYNTSNPKTFSMKSVTKPMDQIMNMLSAEINTRMMLMMTYANKEDLDGVKTLWEDVYQTYMKFFIGCLKHLPDDGEIGVYSCLESVEWLASGGKQDFMKFVDQFSLVVKKKRHWEPKSEDIKGMEASVIVFRNYVNFRLLSLLTLTNAYVKSGGRIFKSKAKHFLSVLNKELSLFISYGQFIHDSIRKHYDADTRKLYKSQKCEILKNNDKIDHTNLQCSYQFSTMFQDHLCHVEVTVFPDDQTSATTAAVDQPQCEQSFMTESTDSVKAAQHFTATIIKPYYEEYAIRMNNMVENYWGKTFLNSIKVWQEIRTAAFLLSNEKYDNNKMETIIYKLKPQQMKQVNSMKNQIKTSQAKRKEAKRNHGFVRHDSKRDEL